MLHIWRTKKAFKVKQKAAFIIFKELSLKQIKQSLLERETPTLNNNQNTVPRVIKGYM